MHPSVVSTRFGLTCTLVLGGLMFGTASAQPGRVLGYEKIDSSTLAAHGVQLNDSDEFGDAVASLGDLDGPGPSTVALAVGAIGDDDGGSHHGAVYKSMDGRAIPTVAKVVLIR